ncbi:MAG: hypothetical protein WCF18_01975 [Chthoniobacteraceae bacterium]
MQLVKRIEIIIDSPELPALVAVLQQEKVPGYTVFHNLSGAGDRGERRNDEPGGGGGNACVLIAATPVRTPAIVEAIRPILKRRGGICLVSDAQSVIH